MGRERGGGGVSGGWVTTQSQGSDPGQRGGGGELSSNGSGGEPSEEGEKAETGGIEKAGESVV